LLKYYVYILKSLKDGKFYTGCTADLKKRLKQHNNGMVRSTKARRPLKLVYWETFTTRSEAMRRERYLKRIGRAEKKALVKNFDGACDDIY
jgi:putative endonuclease